MRTSQEAILRCASNLRSYVPSRIVDTDLEKFGREGNLKIRFDYQEISYEHVVPFTRPFLNQKTKLFANLLNLNQKRSKNNFEFQELIRKITKDFSVHPAPEIACRIELITKEEGKGGHDQTSITAVTNNPPPSPIAPAAGAEKLPLDDSQTHYIVFAEQVTSFLSMKLAKYFPAEKVKQLLERVNSTYECGNTYTPTNNPPYITLMPIFNLSKVKELEEQFLQRVFADVIKSQNNYFKKFHICMVYSVYGFPNQALFESEWNKVVQSLEFKGSATFLGSCKELR